MLDDDVRSIAEREARVTIERARWRDLRPIAAIQKASFRPGLAYGLVALWVLRVMPGVTFLVARLPETPVAGCIIADRDRSSLRVMNLAVAVEARRKGVGAALLRAAERAIPDGDSVLVSEMGNTGAQALYGREGYERHGIARDYYGPGHHGVQMRKRRTAEAARTIHV